VKPYTFEDVVRTLNSVQPYDWASFLNQRLESTSARAPLNGIMNGGYNLVYNGEESEYWKTRESVRRVADLSYSLGFTVHDTGDIIDVHLNSPAFQGGVAPDTKVVAVNGRQFTTSILHQAVQDSTKTATPMALLIKDGEYYRTLNVDYHGGEKYPHLARDKSKPDLISEIIRPRVTAAKHNSGGPK
jgi:predicted metalloprotease with PDZ domain